MIGFSKFNIRRPKRKPHQFLQLCTFAFTFLVRAEFFFHPRFHLGSTTLQSPSHSSSPNKRLWLCLVLQASDDELARFAYIHTYIHTYVHSQLGSSSIKDVHVHFHVNTHKTMISLQSNSDCYSIEAGYRIVSFHQLTCTETFVPTYVCNKYLLEIPSPHNHSNANRIDAVRKNRDDDDDADADADGSSSANRDHIKLCKVMLTTRKLAHSRAQLLTPIITLPTSNLNFITSGKQ